MGDLKSFQMRFVALRQAMIADGIRAGVPFHEKDLSEISERISHEGTSFVKVTLPLLGRALDHGLVSGVLTTPANFSMKKDTRLPRLFYGVFSTIFEPGGALRDEPYIPSIQYLRQVLLFDAKLLSESSAEQKKLAVQGFRQRQANLSKIRLDTTNPVLQRARWLLGEVLRGLDLSDISPGHGPGAVAEKIGREERWDFSAWPAKAERYYPYLLYGTPSMRASLERGRGIPLRKRMGTRCCLVPKDFRGPRLISAEPTVNQYLQQGQMKSIMRYIEKHPVLSKSIKLSDQSHNQDLARVAYARGLVTLDLSDASDTVSAPLVWFLLSRVPQLRRYLFSTRSDFLAYEGEEIRLYAFAPMGSATCFPVETLVFWALSLASLGHVRSLSGHPDERESLSLDVAVFGDDIIIPADGLSTLVHTLLLVGCSPNMSKTCYATPFRESCGTEWHNGFDVTLIRNKRYHYEERKSLSNHPVLLGLQRKFFLRGLFCTAKLCEEWAGEIHPVLTVPLSVFPGISRGRRDPSENQLFRGVSCYEGLHGQAFCREYSQLFSGECYQRLGDDEDFSFGNRSALALDSYYVALGWSYCIYGTLRVRWNRDYQRMEFRVPTAHQRSMNWRTEGYSRLFARLSSDRTDRFVSRDRKIKMTWVTLPHAPGAFTLDPL